MIIKTEKYYRKTFSYAGILSGDKTVKRTTYWLLFIPVYIANEVVNQNGIK